MKKVFITGANGFIGKNIKEQLKKKYQFLTPSKTELDLLNRQQVDDFFRNNKIDVVVHCAVVGGSIKEQEVSHALSDNLRMFFNVLSNNKRFKKMIHLGSGSEYDKNIPLVKILETDFGKRTPEDDYALFKFTLSKIIENVDNIVCLRIFGLFGKYDDYRLRFISNAIFKNIVGLPIKIRQNRVFDFLYIDDFVTIIDHFISHDFRYKFYNIGTGSQTDLLSIARHINAISKKKSKIIVTRPGLGNEYTCNIQRLKKEVPSLQFTDIREAIEKLYQWYWEHKQELVT